LDLARMKLHNAQALLVGASLYAARLPMADSRAEVVVLEAEKLRAQVREIITQAKQKQESQNEQEKSKG
ncbi:unnamed protein product, partial [marine sediment metagenome]